MAYKICSLRPDGWLAPQQVLPTRLLAALSYIDEYSGGEFTYDDIQMYRNLDKSFEPLVPVRETRYDEVLAHLNYTNLLVDMLIGWDEYWEDWEYYNYKTTNMYRNNRIDDNDIFGIFTNTCAIY